MAESPHSPSALAAADEHIALHLQRVPFCLVWWFALLCHCACVAFLGSTIALYVFLGGADMIYYNKLLGSTLRKDMGSLGYVFLANVALHAWEISRMLWLSARARRLTFNPIATPTTAVVPTVPVSAKRAGGGGGSAVAPTTRASGRRRRHHPRLPLFLRRVLPMGLHRRLQRAVQAVRLPPRVARVLCRGGRFLVRCKAKLLDRKQGLLGLESPYFHLVFLLHETTEIASQSYQMNQCSKLISSTATNSLFLAITVLNCWSTPILQHALAHFNALERVVCLSLDALLDFGSCMLIPMVIVVKYVVAFDRTLMEFPVENLTDPQWFTALILENRMLFVMDKTDLFTKLLPHHSLFTCMRKVKRLIHRMPLELESGALEVSYVNSVRVLAPKNKPTADAHSHGEGPSLRQRQGEMPGWKRRVVHHADAACKQQLRPWFSQAFMCASYQFDCVEQGNVASPTGDAFSGLYAPALSSLVVANCPALTMHDELQSFSGLLKFMLYNSTIAAWTANASLNADSHASLISISVVASNMADFPEGLQVQQPDSLQDVHFVQTNLAALPAGLSRGWRVSKIAFEYCAFTEFPPVLLDLHVAELSLARNQFTTLSDELSGMSTAYRQLVLGDNALLTELPASGLPSGTKLLSIESTSISEIPEAMLSSSTTTTAAAAAANASLSGSTAGSGNSSSSSSAAASGGGGGNSGGVAAGPASTLTIYAHNTPLCESLGGVSDGDNGTTSSSSSVVLYCATRDPDGVTRFPLAWTIATFRPSS